MGIAVEEYRFKLRDLLPLAKELAEAIGKDKLLAELADLEAQAQADGFYSDQKNMSRVMQRTKNIRDKIEAQEKLEQRIEDAIFLCQMALDEDDDSFLDEIKAEYEACEKEEARQRLETLLSGEYDGSNAILTFHAGAGGTEAQDWAEMLYRMYTRWAEKRGFKVKVLDYLDGDEAGIKSASIAIEGMNAYGYMKSENGVHRLVRISPFDASGRRQTSFASVEVVPEIDDKIEIEIRPDDLKVDTYRASGAGGQHVNKTESAIRITHLPTGIVVACQTERSQVQNRETAMRMLKSKLFEIKQRENLERIEDIKGDQMANGWGSQIRSYVFMPYTLAKDNRTGYENGNINAVMDGDIDGFINEYLIKLNKGELA